MWATEKELWDIVHLSDSY